jgi:hypothetical protein
MSFREKMRNHNVVMRLGMVFFLLALAANYFVHPTPRFSEGLADGLKGMLYGLAIGFMLLSVRLRARGCTSHQA